MCWQARPAVRTLLGKAATKNGVAQQKAAYKDKWGGGPKGEGWGSKPGRGDVGGMGNSIGEWRSRQPVRKTESERGRESIESVYEKGRTRRDNMTKQQSGVGANKALRDALGGRWVGWEIAHLTGGARLAQGWDRWDGWTDRHMEALT